MTATVKIRLIVLTAAIGICVPTDLDEVYENGKVEKPTDPIKEEYIFDGWYLDDQLFDFSKNIDKNIILVAKYKEDESLKATITFDSDGGSNVEKIIIKKGNKIEWKSF